MRDLALLIPSRREMFLRETIDDALKHIEADTEIIATLDGEWADPPVPYHERVSLIKTGAVVGQRAGTNLACKLTKAKYVMKVDAHCAFDQGFDRKMIEMFQKTGDDVTAVPVMRNLHMFDWKCYHCGWKTYQDHPHDVCGQCGKKDKIRRKMLVYAKPNPRSTSYSFDAEPHFQYFEDWKHREQYKKDKQEKGYTETMSLQGSAFMCTRENYWKWNLCDESLGNWGSQGIEVACKTWLLGGRVLVNHNTFYAHMFRTKGDVFGFPWPASGRETQTTKAKVREVIFNNKIPGQVHPLSWLIKKFWPVPGWKDSDLAGLTQ